MNNRREFLAFVGRGMLVASVGPVVAADLGLSRAEARDRADALSFGKLEPLVAFLQETPTSKLLPGLVAKMKDGTDLRTLVAAGALANARSFGGRHYEGYHTFMALAPAFEMSRELPEAERALPVLKVLYRNATHIQAKGGRKNEELHPVEPVELPVGRVPGEAVRDAARKNDRTAAEGMFATIAKGDPSEAFDQLQYAVHDEVNVHRVVLAWRAWMMLDFTGQEHAHTLLRQSVLFACRENGRGNVSHIQTLLPKLMDQHKLAGKKPGNRTADDAWVEKLGKLVYSGGRERAADAVAAALAEGFSPEVIGEAISLAANELVLRDPGRQRADGAKQKGSVHGDSPGVHASDAANAWRHIARVSSPRNAIASLIVGAYHTAGQNGGQLGEQYPQAEHRARVKSEDPATLLKETEAAVKAQDQALACALVHKYGALGHPVRPVFDLLLRYGVSEDGALHAEKYYRTVTEEFANSRAAFRWRQMVALARVTTSEYGNPAPGYAEARRLLEV
jgi:hypothetical protein